MTLFALTEAISISRALALRTGQHIDANQEFIGQGLSNIAGAFFSGYVATGSFNRSALNYSVGAQTPMAAILAGIFLMFIVVLVAPFAVYLPKATMAGILLPGRLWPLGQPSHQADHPHELFRHSGARRDIWGGAADRARHGDFRWRAFVAAPVSAADLKAGDPYPRPRSRDLQRNSPTRGPICPNAARCG